MVLAGALVCGPALARASEAQPWLHVRVTEDEPKGTKVEVNVPIALLDVALNSIKNKDLHGGRLNLGRHHKDVTVEDLRRMWAELKKAGDAEFVKVEEKDHTVRIARKGDRVQVNVIGHDDGDETVKVDVPLAVVDALLGGEGDSLDLRAAVSELRNIGSGEFIRVDDGRSHVRVWID